jgi:hypothetical protein
VRDCQPGEHANLFALEKVDARGQPQVLMIARMSIVAREDLTCSFGLNGLLRSPPLAGDWFHRRRSSSARSTPRQRVPTPASSGFPAASKTKKRGNITSTPDKPPKPPDDDLMPVERDERVGENMVHLHRWRWGAGATPPQDSERQISATSRSGPPMKHIRPGQRHVEVYRDDNHVFARRSLKVYNALV